MTAKIRLEPVRTEDAPSINRWKNDREIQALSSDSVTIETLQETDARVKRWQTSDPEEIVHFGIRQCDNDELVGFCHLAEIDLPNRRCKLGIVIGERASWGKGLGREALSALIQQAFARGLTRVVGEVYVTNERSVRLCKSLGFSLEGTLRASVLRHGRWVDELIYALVKPERR